MKIEVSRRRFVSASIAFAASYALVGRYAVAKSHLGAARIIVGYAPGGSLDMISRRLAESLTGLYATSVFVENHPGAAGRIAVEVLKRSAPDGSTLLVTPASIVTMYPHIYTHLSYNVERDLQPVTMVAATDFAFAIGGKVPSSVRTLRSFLDWCRANPSEASCSNPGAGSLPHFLAMLLASDAGVSLVHVPFRGSIPATAAVVAGEVASVIGTESALLSLARTGALRIVATSGAIRSSNLQGVATFAEQGFPRMTQREWFAAFMSGQTPAPNVARAADALRAIIARRDVVDVWQKSGLMAVTSTPQALRDAMRSESAFWAPIIRQSGFTPES